MLPCVVLSKILPAAKISAFLFCLSSPLLSWTMLPVHLYPIIDTHRPQMARFEASGLFRSRWLRLSFWLEPMPSCVTARISHWDHAVCRDEKDIGLYMRSLNKMLCWTVGLSCRVHVSSTSGLHIWALRIEVRSSLSEGGKNGPLFLKACARQKPLTDWD